MQMLRPVRVGLLLLGATLAIAVLSAVEGPPPQPHEPSALALARLVIGLPVVLFVPGFFLVPFLLFRDVQTQESGVRSGKLDPGWTLLAALGLTLPAHVLHFNLLRVLHVPIEWPALSALGVAECIAGLILLRRRLPDLEFGSWQAGTARAVALAAGVIVLFGVWASPHLLRDGSWYFQSQSLNQGWEGTAKRDALTVAFSDGTALQNGTSVTPKSLSSELEVANSAPFDQRVPLLLAVHAPVGTAAVLRAGDVILHQETIANLVREQPNERPDERYYQWGTAAMTAQLQMPAQSLLKLKLDLSTDLEPRTLGVEDVRLVGWAGLSSGEVTNSMERLGHHSMHKHQILNVTENIRWADEIAGSYVLPGRSVDGKSTLHQPPAWTYLYAPARELLCDQTVSAGVLLLAILFGITLVGLLGLQDESGAPPAALALVLGLGAVQHGRLMVLDGSLNFPDSLYALALVASVVALCSSRTRVFVVWAGLAALLRYPGAVVVAMAGFTLLAVDPLKRRRIIDALVRFALVIVMFCGVMLVIGGLTKSLDTWLFALYFETVTEHWTKNPAYSVLPWKQRPLEFVRLWMLFGGGVLIAALPLRGRLSKVALGTAVLYAPFLAFIDHFSHHYFLPLIGLAGVATCASVARIESETLKRVLSWGLVPLAAGLLIYSSIGKL